MELRAVDGVRVAYKTVLKVMREMGLRCGIRRETDYHRYNSYKGVVGETFENVIGRDFEAGGPWQKMGTDVTEFRLSFGKAYLAPAYDFGSKEIVAHSISLHPDLALIGVVPVIVGLAADAAPESHLAHHLEHRLVRYALPVDGAQLHGDLAVADAVREPAEDLGDPGAQPGPGRPLRVRERVVVRRPGEPGALQQVGQPVATP